MGNLCVERTLGTHKAMNKVRTKISTAMLIYCIYTVYIHVLIGVIVIVKENKERNEKTEAICFSVY